MVQHTTDAAGERLSLSGVCSSLSGNPWQGAAFVYHLRIFFIENLLLGNVKPNTIMRVELPLGSPEVPVSCVAATTVLTDL